MWSKWGLLIWLYDLFWLEARWSFLLDCQVILTTTTKKDLKLTLYSSALKAIIGGKWLVVKSDNYDSFIDFFSFKTLTGTF